MIVTLKSGCCVFRAIIKLEKEEYLPNSEYIMQEMQV